MMVYLAQVTSVPTFHGASIQIVAAGFGSDAAIRLRCLGYVQVHWANVNVPNDSQCCDCHARVWTPNCNRRDLFSEEALYLQENRSLYGSWM